jgi:hypothetical protein
VQGRISVDATRIDLARHLESEGVRSAALLDVGLFAYRAPSITIIDLGGLVDPVIARAPGRHGSKLAPLDYLERRAPDVVILTSAHEAESLPDGSARVQARFPCEQHLETSSWLRERYAYYDAWDAAPNYRIHVFRRRASPTTSAAGSASPGADRDSPPRADSRTARR